MQKRHLKVVCAHRTQSIERFLRRPLSVDLPLSQIIDRVALRVARIDQIVVRLAKEDEILERPALVIGHRRVISIPRSSVSDVSDLEVDIRLTVNENDELFCAAREVAPTVRQDSERRAR